MGRENVCEVILVSVRLLSVCVGRIQVACCGNTVLMVRLGLGQKNHLVMLRKQSCFDLKVPDFGCNKQS